MKPFVAPPRWPDCSILLTPEQAAELFTPEEITSGVSHFTTTDHEWGHGIRVTKSISGIVISAVSPAERFTREPTVYTVYGRRAMTGLKASGYATDGWVSVGGKRRSCFTSDHLFELPGKKLISAGVLYMHTKQKP